MSPEIVQQLTSVVERLLTLAATDTRFRADLHQLAVAVLSATAPLEAPADQRERAGRDDEPIVDLPGEEPPAIVDDRPVVSAAAEEERSVEPEPLPELTLGQRTLPLEPAHRPAPITTPTQTQETVDLGQTEARCRLKAEGARWAARRQRLLSEGASFDTEIDPVDRDIIARAKALPDCYLWMCNPRGPTAADLRQYDEIANYFETVADLLALVRQILDSSEQLQGEFEQCLDLLAEAQSALRVLIRQLADFEDSDQRKVFLWLKTQAAEQQIFIGRHMRIDDPADPARWSDLTGRVDELDNRLQEANRRTKLRRKLIGKVRHKASQIANDPEAADVHAENLAETIDELINDGLPPSNVELRDLLLPIVDDIPDLPNPQRGFLLVLREIDRYLASCPQSERTAPAVPTAEVQQVAELLEGRSLVLIGGDRRADSERALKQAFKLQTLIWIETRDHQSIQGFEAYVARPEVAVVILAIRWASHSFGDVREFCERYDKPLVRLPGGYNPNQVAMQIMEQCSDRLRTQVE